MKKIIAFENAIANKVANLRDCGINPAIFQAYRTSSKNGNDLIDFHDVIWDEDVNSIVETLDANDITEFTISSNFSGLIKTLAVFEQHGFKIAGTTEVKAPYRDLFIDDYAKIPALLMKKEV